MKGEMPMKAFCRGAVGTQATRVFLSTLLLCSIALVTACGDMAAEGEEAMRQTGIEATSAPKYDVNEYGETYGSAPELAGFVGDSRDYYDLFPDLILSEAEGGTVGYTRKSDIMSPESPSSPEDALKMQEETKGKTCEVPVYGVDGRTAIGFLINSKE